MSHDPQRVSTAAAVLRRELRALGNRWGLAVLAALELQRREEVGDESFGVIKRRIRGIHDEPLSKALEHLVEQRLATKANKPLWPGRVDVERIEPHYAISTRGRLVVRQLVSLVSVQVKGDEEQWHQEVLEALLDPGPRPPARYRSGESKGGEAGPSDLSVV